MRSTDSGLRWWNANLETNGMSLVCRLNPNGELSKIRKHNDYYYKNAESADSGGPQTHPRGARKSFPKAVTSGMR